MKEAVTVAGPAPAGVSTLSHAALSASVHGVSAAAVVMFSVVVTDVVLPKRVAMVRLAGVTATGGMRKLHTEPLTVLPSKFRVSMRQ